MLRVLRDRSCASFACAIGESAAALTSREAPPPLYVCMSSDARTRTPAAVAFLASATASGGFSCSM
eukprot:3363341-Pleurochrysis_carterae.AAC.1